MFGASAKIAEKAKFRQPTEQSQPYAGGVYIPTRPL